MTDDQFQILLMAIGFGLGSIFWILLYFVCMGGK